MLLPTCCKRRIDILWLEQFQMKPTGPISIMCPQRSGRIFRRCLRFVGNFHGTIYGINSRKAPIHFRFYCARDRKLTLSCFLDFWDPWEPLFMDLNIPSYFKNTRTNGNIVKHIILENVEMQIHNFESFGNGGINTLETIGVNDC